LLVRGGSVGLVRQDLAQGQADWIAAVVLTKNDPVTERTSPVRSNDR
jgi:hypothetical protein